MVRIVYAIRSDGNIILLEPFAKRHKRNTARALESSPEPLGKIDAGDCPVRRLGTKEMEELL
jgi:hypothetical protein